MTEAAVVAIKMAVGHGIQAITTKMPPTLSGRIMRMHVRLGMSHPTAQIVAREPKIVKRDQCGEARRPEGQRAEQVGHDLRCFARNGVALGW
jgi:hypothetical protein